MKYIISFRMLKKNCSSSIECYHDPAAINVCRHDKAAHIGQGCREKDCPVLKLCLKRKYK